VYESFIAFTIATGTACPRIPRADQWRRATITACAAVNCGRTTTRWLRSHTVTATACDGTRGMEVSHD